MADRQTDDFKLGNKAAVICGFTRQTPAPNPVVRGHERGDKHMAPTLPGSLPGKAPDTSGGGRYWLLSAMPDLRSTIRKPSKECDMTYQELCSFDTLWTAYHRARRCKRGKKKSMAPFEYSAIEELLILKIAFLKGRTSRTRWTRSISTNPRSGLSRPRRSGTRWCSTRSRITSSTTSWPGASR